MNNSIDILLPYWGEFKLLKQTIDSVLAQTSDKWTLTIIDDCYPSLEAKEYCKKLNNSKVKYIRHKNNIGITNNFNFCIDIAQSNYCMILGCDDVLMPSYVEVALNNIGENDFYQPSVLVIDKDSKECRPLVDTVKQILRPKKQGIYRGEKLAISLCRGNWLYFPSITWKTSTLKKYRFDSKYKTLEDVIVELNIIKDGGSLFVDNTPTFKYRRFADSVSSKEKTKNGSRFKEEDEVYNKFAQEFSKIGWNKAAKASRLHITSRIHKIIS